MPPAQQPIITPVPPPIPPRKKSSRLAIGIAIGIGAIPGLLFIAYVLYLFTGIIYLIGHATLGPSFAGMQTNNLVSKVRQLPHVKSAVSKVGFGYNGFGFEAKLTIVGEDNTTNDQALEILKSSIPIFHSKFSNTKVIYKQSYAGGELAFISNSLSGIEKYQNDIPPTLTALRHELEGGMSNAWATSSYDDQHPAGSISCSSLTTSSSASKVKKMFIRATIPDCPNMSRIWDNNGHKLDVKGFSGDDFSWLAFDAVSTAVSQPEVTAIYARPPEDKDKSRSISYSIVFASHKRNPKEDRMSRSEKDITAKLLKDLRNSQLKTIVHVDFFWPHDGVIINQGNFLASTEEYDLPYQTANRQDVLDQVKCELDESHQKEACSTL